MVNKCIYVVGHSISHEKRNKYASSENYKLHLMKLSVNWLSTKTFKKNSMQLDLQPHRKYPIFLITFKVRNLFGYFNLNDIRPTVHHQLMLSISVQVSLISKL